MEKRLDMVDLTKEISSKKEYKKQLKYLQFEMLKLQQTLLFNEIPAIFVFEGWDAAGKGGAIKRLTQRLDPRGYKVYPISAPTHEEKQQHYLQRFWTKLPSYGEIVLFDRSWYGRVLVERVEEFATPNEWRRSYSELNHFEKMLSDEGFIIGKFWFEISKEEQLERFRERQKDPLKRWKITEEDWRNRQKWDEYVEAVNDMFAHTDSDYAPWTIIEGNDKQFARVKTLEVMVETIRDYLRKRGIRTITEKEF
ncbi:polyphosphate kinase 2 family protein [Bacillus solimangrovi]|uniref:UDP-galactose-lipid carrier transferase n=1 Tax=Bacillus solimangrovi TaxID=1305675 RepID=A0A1E5LH23_9BACI|nr:UDP-galactose-lipid carrier transferase [Bacillus solimangrovi]OEH93372.1 UDP-galactose-lipid carrier transferase [Bacillus solimangrovi]